MTCFTHPFQWLIAIPVKLNATYTFAWPKNIVLRCTKENNLENVVYFRTITHNLHACMITKSAHKLSHCKTEDHCLNILTGKESLFHHFDSKSKKWSSTEADKEAGQNNVLSQLNYGNCLLEYWGMYWFTCYLEGINHCHFLHLDTEKIVTCTLQQVPNEETHHISAWFMTSPIHLMSGVTGKVHLWNSPPSSPQFRLGLIRLHTTCSWPWNITLSNCTTRRARSCVNAVNE
jgi:hypothetical protein